MKTHQKIWLIYRNNRMIIINLYLNVPLTQAFLFSCIVTQLKNICKNAQYIVHSTQLLAIQVTLELLAPFRKLGKSDYIR